MINFENEYGYFIFDPRGCEDDYKDKYPELTEYEEFKKVSARELVWVWLVANKTSPIIKTPFKERCKEAAIYVFGAEYNWKTKLNRKGIEKMASADPEEHIVTAIEKMSKFSFVARKTADKIVEQMFKDLQEVMRLTSDDFKDKDDIKNISAFLSSRKQVRQELTELLPIIEKGFGVKKSGKTIDLMDVDGQSVHETFHKNEQNNHKED